MTSKKQIWLLQLYWLASFLVFFMVISAIGIQIPPRNIVDIRDIRILPAILIWLIMTTIIQQKIGDLFHLEFFHWREWGREKQKEFVKYTAAVTEKEFEKNPGQYYSVPSIAFYRRRVFSLKFLLVVAPLNMVEFATALFIAGK